MEKLIFKVDKKAMGPYNYIGFRKFTGKNCAIAKSGGDFLIIDPGEYIELGFVDKPDVSNWKNEISEQEFKHSHYGDALGSGSIDDIKLMLTTTSIFKRVN